MQTGERLQNLKNFAIYFHVDHLHFCFEVFFTVLRTSQVSANGFKSFVVRLRKVSASYKALNKALYKALNEKILVFRKSRLFFLISLLALKQNTQLQSNFVNIDTEWAIYRKCPY